MIRAERERMVHGIEQPTIIWFHIGTVFYVRTTFNSAGVNQTLIVA